MILPWIVSGDFSTTLNLEERLRKELQHLVVDIEMGDLRFTGNFFTWSTKHTDHTIMVCKLDRALANAVWVNELENSEAIFLNPGVSDHSSCLSKFNATFQKKKHVSVL